MLKRFKEQVSQVANELPTVLGGSRDSRDSSYTVQNNYEEVEGLICPVCMEQFSTTNQLSSHFELSHPQNGFGVSNPNYDAPSDYSSPGSTSSSSVSFATKDQELDEVRTQLREEKRFAERLKEELHSIQAVIAQASDVPEGEVPYLMQQIQVLTADKGMVTKQFLEMEKDNTQQKRILDQLKAERSDLVAKLKQMSTQQREMTDESEEIKVSKEQLARDLKAANLDNRKYEVEVSRLEKMLDMRPSEDDVAVLRTELVNAQKLMDEISQQKDVEIQEQLSSIRHLSLEREKQHLVIKNLTEQLATNGYNAKGTEEEITNLTVELSQLQDSLKTVTENKELLCLEATKNEERIAELQARIVDNVKELASCRENISALEEKVKASNVAVEDSSSLNDSNQKKLVQLQEKLDQMIAEKRRYEEDVCEFEEKAMKNNDNFRSMEMANLDLTNELASIGSLLDQERKLIQEKNVAIGKKDDEIAVLKEKVAEAEKNLKKRSSELGEKENVVANLTKQIQTLQENSKELMQKVMEGEGGAKMAIDQLDKEKRKITDELTFIVDNLSAEKSALEATIGGLEKKIREKEASIAEKDKKASEEREEFSRRLREAEDDVNRKTERYVEMEKEAEMERIKTNSRIQKMKDIVVQKDKGAEEMRRQIDELSSSVAERERNLKERDRHLDENRKKIEGAVKRLEEAELRARQLESERQAQQSETSALDQEVGEVRAKLAKSDEIIEQLKLQLEHAANEMAEKRLEMDQLASECLAKETHWKVKREEFEQQLERNQEANEETIVSLRKLHEEFTKEKEALSSANKSISELAMRNLELTGLVEELEAKLASVRVSSETLQKQHDKNVGEKDELEKLGDVLRVQLDKAKSNFSEVQDLLKQEVEKHESQLASLEREKAEMEAELTARSAIIRELEDTLINKEKELASLNEANRLLLEDAEQRVAEHDNFNERIAKFEMEMATERRRIEELESEKAEQTCLHENFVKQSEEAKKVLSEKDSAYEKELEQLSKSVLEKTTALEKLQKKQTQFEKMFEDVQRSTQQELHEKAQQIELAQEKVTAAEEASTKKCGELESEIERLRRLQGALESDLSTQRAHLNDAKMTSQQLAEVNIDLQKQIDEWQEEKKVLIERCLNGESDLDFERDRALENKRRFDEALSAMHELGRANQSLQMDMDRHTSRKWLDDSAAVNCTDCGKTFSLTIRKHHCRVCGLIYCAQCSSKTARIPSAKNPVRVCGNCHSEIESR